MFFTADMFVAHAIGDYVIQSDWMATEKTKKSLAAAVHAFTYTLPFLFLTQNPLALAFIMITHFIIDRWRLARYVCWIKNFLQPKTTVLGYHYMMAGHRINVNESWKDISYVQETLSRNHKWEDCNVTGYHKDRPPWLAFWLLIITDNLMHIICNALALNLLG
jgi:hypothetical protein